jgi:alkylation response protein AidB-like acyl-CoA dehydrogenase
VDLNDTPEQAQYRARVRSWLEEHRDEAPVLRGDGAIEDEQEAIAAHRGWQRKLAEAGFVGVTWPREYGGQGLGPLEQVIVNQEIVRAGVPGILDAIGVGMLGPTIIAHGTEEQKQRYLAPMLHADEVWCQLFSEPAAGSDLAGIQTRARQDDGGWRLSGQKVWTTNAQFAAFGLLLARTDFDVPKHKGLTMFIVPMDAEGVTVRGLRQITGDAEFNEVFFDDVALDGDMVVGPVNGGWGTALTTLMFERLTIGGGGGEGLGFSLTAFAQRLGADEAARTDPDVRRRFGELAAEMLSLRFTGYRSLTALQRGQIPGPEAALGKVTLVNAAIGVTDLVADAIGPDTYADAALAYGISFLPGLKSAGGTEEILRNTVGERVLGLPPEPRLDKGIPFAELRAREREAAKAAS